MSKFLQVQSDLKKEPKTWLVTGVAGFIGSNLLEALLKFDQKVVGLDNLSTGYMHNLDAVKSAVGADAFKNFHFIKGDVSNVEDCKEALNGVSYVLHQAALGSVPRSLEDPVGSHKSNVDGFVKMLDESRKAKVMRFVYASSSAVYGDSPELPKKEGNIGSPLSPYAATKLINENYSRAWAKSYGFKCVGLRYFNVFGPRQDPNGAYAAVVPRWIDCAIGGKPCTVYGDGETSRDFCHIDNVVQANILAACSEDSSADEVYNVAFGERTTLSMLHDLIWENIVRLGLIPKALPPIKLEFRAGDIRHSLADVSKTKQWLGYEPTVPLNSGLAQLVDVTAKTMGKAG